MPLAGVALSAVGAARRGARAETCVKKNLRTRRRSFLDDEFRLPIGLPWLCASLPTSESVRQVIDMDKVHGCALTDPLDSRVNEHVQGDLVFVFS